MHLPKRTTSPLVGGVVAASLVAVLLVGLGGALTACAPAGGGSSATGTAGARAQNRAQTTPEKAPENLEAERTKWESEKARKPTSVDVRVALGDVYYRSARQALDRDRDEERYLELLGLAVEEFVSATELDPRDDRPHFYLAVMDAYRGDIKKALRGFNNARRLNPSGVAYTNIAEIFIYMDAIDKAYTWNDLGSRKGAPASAVLFNEMLIAWKENDLREAESIFARLREHYPQAIETINVARLPKPPRRFAEFAGYCCQSPACGPYMATPCERMELAVKEQELSEEAVLRQLRIEMEKTRRLEKVYQQRKELEVDIEGAPAAR